MYIGHKNLILLDDLISLCLDLDQIFSIAVSPPATYPKIFSVMEIQGL